VRDYKLGKPLGRGGFGEVYEATRLNDQAPVAVKFVRINGDERKLARFRRELRLQGELVNRHVVPVLDLGVEEDPAWCVMPRAETSLGQFLADRRFDRDVALNLFFDACAGLSFAHEQGVLHRDIKPDNILLFRDGQQLTAALSDFGLGRRIDRDTPTITATRVGMGTPGYMAPEQRIAAKYVDERADIFSMGRVLFQIRTGRMPPALNDIDLSLVDPKYAYIVRKATYEDPDRRYQSMTEFMEDILLAERPVQSANEIAELARDLSAKIANLEKPDPNDLENLARLLLANIDDFNLIVHTLPRMPYDVINRLFGAHDDLLGPVLLKYDSYISEQIPSSYCTQVASLYEAIYNGTPASEYRLVILKRLIALGARHNDWGLGNLLRQLLADTADPEIIGQLKDYLADNPDEDGWYQQFAFDATDTAGEIF